MDKTVADAMPGEVKFIFKESPNYKVEFINGALSTMTPRGEIVCNLYFESRDLPSEQVATVIENGMAKLSDIQETTTFTREVKFGIVINVPFAKDLVKLLNKKIEESEAIEAKKAEAAIINESG